MSQLPLHPLTIGQPEIRRIAAVAELERRLAALERRPSAAGSHTHVISDVTGLQAALDAKATVGDLTTLSTLVGTKADSAQPAFIVVGSGGSAPAFAVNWSNVAGTYPDARFFLDTVGMVHLSGLVKSTSAAVNQTIFTLPAGYRPAETLHFNVPANDAFGIVRVLSTGVVQWGVGTPTTYVSLDAIPPFRAEA